MGCLLGKFWKRKSKSTTEENVPKIYSWDKKETKNYRDFILENIEYEKILKTPGSINGEQFIIQNCNNCSLFVLDNMSTATIDDCKNCIIYLGPMKGSLFIRNSDNCKLFASCQQFRSRDCKKLEVHLYCATQPIIESSIGMKFACLQLFYPELAEDLKAANLNIYRNNWNKIYDFTPVQGETNYSFLEEKINFDNYIPVEFKSYFSLNNSLIPKTSGQKIYADESCLVVFFHDNDIEKRIQEFEKNLDHENSSLVETNSISLSAFEAAQLFEPENNLFIQAAASGNIIGMEWSGKDICKNCNVAAHVVLMKYPGLIFVSINQQVASKQIETFHLLSKIELQH